MWNEKSFDELTTEELFQIYYMRTSIFVVEQNRIFQEVDENDLKAIHIFKMEDNKVVAYARVFERNDHVTFGRFGVAKSARGKGLANELIQHVLEVIKDTFWSKQIKITAQVPVAKFYEKWGFTTEGQPFMFESTPHITMNHDKLK